MILSDEANAAFPARRGVIEDEEDLELAAMQPQELFKIVLEKDIFLVYVGVDEADGSFICRVAEDSANNLNHGGNTGTTGNHAEVVAEARGVDKVALGAFDTDSVANLEAGKDTRNVTLLVSLDEKFEFSMVVVTTHGGVATSYKLSINFCGHGDVLTNRKAKNILSPAKLKAVNGCVGRNLDLLLERELLPFIRIESLGLA